MKAWLVWPAIFAYVIWRHRDELRHRYRRWQARVPTRVRRAQPEDSDRVYHLWKRAWHETYDSMLGFERSDQFSSEITGDFVKSKIAEQDEYQAVFLAEQKSDIVGICTCSFHKDFGADFIGSFYVLRSAQGTGAAQSLLARVIRIFPNAWFVALEVLSDNHRALRFYEKSGFCYVSSNWSTGGLASTLMMKRLGCIRNLRWRMNKIGSRIRAKIRIW